MDSEIGYCKSTGFFFLSFLTDTGSWLPTVFDIPGLDLHFLMAD